MENTEQQPTPEDLKRSAEVAETPEDLAESGERLVAQAEADVAAFVSEGDEMAQKLATAAGESASDAQIQTELGQIRTEVQKAEAILKEEVAATYID